MFEYVAMGAILPLSVPYRFWRSTEGSFLVTSMVPFYFDYVQCLSVSMQVQCISRPSQTTTYDPIRMS